MLHAHRNAVERAHARAAQALPEISEQPIGLLVVLVRGHAEHRARVHARAGLHGEDDGRVRVGRGGLGEVEHGDMFWPAHDEGGSQLFRGGGLCGARVAPCEEGERAEEQHGGREGDEQGYEQLLRRAPGPVPRWGRGARGGA